MYPARACADRRGPAAAARRATSRCTCACMRALVGLGAATRLLLPVTRPCCWTCCAGPPCTGASGRAPAPRRPAARSRRRSSSRACCCCAPARPRWPRRPSSRTSWSRCFDLPPLYEHKVTCLPLEVEGVLGACAGGPCNLLCWNLDRSSWHSGLMPGLVRKSAACHAAFAWHASAC